MVVHKYPLCWDTIVQEIMIPEGCEILTVQIQWGELQLWAKVDPDRPTVGVRIQLVETGSIVPCNARYISTIQANGGAYVGHIFEILE